MRRKNPFLLYAALIGLMATALFSCGARAQGVVVGAEKVISYTGTNASIAQPNTPATNFTATGTTTFILPVANPTVSVRLYITNDTVNVCTGAFTVQMFSATDAQTNTFNGALTNWQVAPVQDPLGSGQLIGITGLLTIPASGAIYISSTAIAAPKVAIQIVNTSAGCASTTLEITAVISQVSVTSPLVSASSASIFGGNASQVQGVIPSGQNGSPVFPLIQGVNQPPVNAGFQTVGLDNFSTSTVPIASGLTQIISVGNPPRPSKTNDFGIAFSVPPGGGASTTLVAPWTCSNIDTACNPSAFAAPQLVTLANAAQVNALQWSFNNSSAQNSNTSFLLFNVATGTPTIRQSAHGNVANPAYGSNTLSGSTLAIAEDCQAAPFVPGTITDTQGNHWVQIPNASINLSSGSGVGLAIFIPTNLSSAAADTLTIAGESCGGNFNWRIFELTGVSPANKNTPAGFASGTNNAFIAGEDDNGTQISSPGYFDVTGTIVLGTGSTTLNLFQQTQHGIMQSCMVSLRVTAASGTTPTLNTYFQDSPDLVGWNDRLSFPQATAAANYIGAISGGGAGITPVVTTNGTLAVSTKVDGPVGENGRLLFVVAGTTPSFTVTYGVACR